MQYISTMGELAMQSVTMGTTNQAKIAQIAGALSLIGVEVRGVQDKSLLPEVIEDGTTVAENARKKAIAYAGALGTTVLSMDNALYLDGLPLEDQPGIHVRRINGEVRSSDDELLDHYQQVIRSLGGRIGGRWDFGVCVAGPDGRVWETVIKSPRVFTSERSQKTIHGYPLESLQVDPETGVYIAEMSQTEQAEFWQRAIGSELCRFIQSIK